MGIVNVTPDSFSDGGDFLDAGAAIAHARELVARGRGHRRRRRRVDAARAPSRWRREEELRRVVPVLEGIAAATGRASAALGRRSRSTPPRRRSRARRSTPARARQRRDRAARRPGDGRAWSPTAGVECCLMHMLGEPRTMQRDPRYDDVVDDVKAFLEERAGVRGRARASRERADHARPGHRLRQDGRAQPRAAAPPARAARRSGARSWSGTSRKSFLGRILGATRRGGRAGRRRAAAARHDRHERARARARRERASASTTSRRCATRSRWRLLRWASDGRRGARRRRRRARRRRGGARRRSRGSRRVGHGRDHRPVAVHPPRRQRGRARGRPAAGARPAPRRRRDRRDRDRLDRGHGRLRGGLPARRAGRPAALAQDARAPVQHDRRPPARRLRARGRVGEGDASPSRRSR